MNACLSDLKNELLEFYPEEEWPCLLTQAEEWGRSRPLEGLRVLDTTPLFRNTLAKFMVLLAAGAKLYVHSRGEEFGDAAAYARALTLGVGSCDTEGFLQMEAQGEPMDIILDCMGVAACLSPRLGYVELTRSGVAYYQHSPLPVIVVDAGRIKLIETSLGTSNGFFRAMDALGYAERAGRSLVVVGCGKVGMGVIRGALAEGMQLCAIDLNASVSLPDGVRFVCMSDKAAAQAAMESAWCLVMVTGHPSALEGYIDLDSLAASPVILANLGAEDEYGPHMPAERVLNGKETLNFMLEDPTRMPYIETTMALHNACALDLLAGGLAGGCHEPRPELEEELLALVRKAGVLSASELDLLEA